MEIRRATEDDVAALVRFGEFAHDESPRYRTTTFDGEKAAQFMQQALANEWVVTLLAVDGERIVGAFIGMLTPYFFATDMYGVDLFFYVLPDHRGRLTGLRLIREWEGLLEADGRAAESTLGVTAGIENERVRDLYRRLGYQDSGYYMVKRYE